MTDYEVLQHQLTRVRVRRNFDRNHAQAGGWDALKTMVEAGASLSQMATRFGLTRQRISQVIKTGGLRP